MQTKMPIRCHPLNRIGNSAGAGAAQAITAANNANGNAKIVWLNRIIASIFWKVVIMLVG